MTDASIYRDIAGRTGGNVYIGVVGPVRTGKSTFIKRFMESLVLPNITEGYDRDRARDELPQSAAGKTVMTTEPKFIPDEAVEINPGGVGKLRVRMIDCVGYVVPEALGVLENGQPRLVRTPWSEDPVPFIEAAETGTRKVIKEHSTVGMVVTTDGSIADIPREAYIESEERVVRELRELGKPFAVILNSAKPSSDAAVALGHELESKYGVPVALVNCLDLDSEDIQNILAMVLNEFPVTEVTVSLPDWIAALPEDHEIRRSVGDSVRECAAGAKKIGEIDDAFAGLEKNEYISDAKIKNVDLGTGKAEIVCEMRRGLYYDVLGQMTGFSIKSEEEMFALLCELAEVKKKFDKIDRALSDAEDRGYGIVMPDVSELHLEEPEIVRHSGGYGVKLRASAQSIHMIRANIETEISPVVGTEQQSEDLVKYLLHEFEESPAQIWESNIFGKSLYELVNEGLHSKLEHMPDDARTKLSETLERIINEGSGGLICILL
ncbi:MAG: stage IV sporulation protein A [Clostridia bacterium]|nr:stage IV sporulation protein A [Clostridia bacterium]